MGDITLTIDADTAGYIAKISALSQKHKELGETTKDMHKPFEKMGEFSRNALEAIAGFAIPLTAAGVAMKGLETIADSWRDKMRQARDVLKENQDLNQTFARAGLGAQSSEYSKLMKAQAGNLSNADIASVVSNVTAPGNMPDASKDALVKAAKVAGDAKKAGMDPGAFAGNWARMTQAKIPNPEDLATYQARYIGENEKFAGAAAKNPKQANDLARYFAGAASAPDRNTSSVLGTLAEKWSSMELPGTFGDFLNSGLAVHTVGRDKMSTLNYLRTNQGPEVGTGMLAKMAASAESDPDLKAKTDVESAQNRAKNIISANYGGDAINKEKKLSRKDEALADEDGGRLGLFMKAATGNREAIAKEKFIAGGGSQSFTDFLRNLEKNGDGIPVRSGAWGSEKGAQARDRSVGAKGAGDLMGAGNAAELLREQNILLQRQRIRANAHDENAK